jgi:hypothetical protein
VNIWRAVGGGALLVAVLGSLWTAFADAAGQHPALSGGHASQSKSRDAGSAKPEPPPQPTVTSVYPAVGDPDAGAAGMQVELSGSHFREKGTKVLFGPGGVSGECRGVEVLSDSLLRCHMPKNVVSGEVEHFVVISTFDGGAVSSDVSAGAYKRLPAPQVRDAGVSSNDALFAVQMHILGRDFGQAGDTPPTVAYGDTNAGKSYLCDNVVVLNAEELICYLPRSVYDSLVHPIHFTVQRPSP